MHFRLNVLLIIYSHSFRPYFVPDLKLTAQFLVCNKLKVATTEIYCFSGLYFNDIGILKMDAWCMAKAEILATTTTAPCGHFQYHQFLMPRVFNRILTMKLNEGNLLLTF